MTDNTPERQAGRTLDWHGPEDLEDLAYLADRNNLPRRWLAVRVPPQEWREAVETLCADMQDEVRLLTRITQSADSMADEVERGRNAAAYRWLANLLTEALAAMDKGVQGDG